MKRYIHNGSAQTMSPSHILKRFSLILILVYVIAVLIFYFLAGEQLHLRESRGNTELPEAQSGTVELSAGNFVEQQFSVEIQRLETISVQWGTYYRANTGTVVMELCNLSDNRLLMSERFDMASIEEGMVLTMEAEEPLEGMALLPLMLRIYSPDSQPGSAVSPLMNVQPQMQQGVLWLNGTQVDGTLCFAAAGSDYIWTGLHYWEFAAVGFVIIILALTMVWLRNRNGKHSYVLNALAAIQKYRFLIRQLVSRDFKTKYKRSILGVFWSFLNPLLMMIVQYFVFSTIFKSDIPNYPVYLLIGIISFNFFSEACGMSLTSILGNAGLITKVYMPKYIYPLTRVMSSVINLAISLIPLLIVAVVTGVHFEKSAVLALYFLFCLTIFSLGFGLMLSASMVFFRDTQFLWNVLSTIWMYATPIFYPESIIPDNLKFVHHFNPLYYFLKNARMCVLDGISPEPIAYAQCLLMAFVTLCGGAMIFRKTQDKFVLYL